MGIILRFTMGATPPRKKSKPASKYLEKWEADSRFTGWLTKSKHGPSHAYCRLCNRDFRVDNGGLNDVTKHFNTGMHKNNSKAQNSDARLFVTRTFRDLVHKTFRDPDLSGPGSFVTYITTFRDLINISLLNRWEIQKLVIFLLS